MIIVYRFSKPYTFGDLLKREIRRQEPARSRVKSEALRLFNGPAPQPETVEL